MTKFGHRIGSLRVARNLSLSDAAYLTSIPVLNLQAIEEGIQIPTEEMVKDLARAFETDEEDLLQLWRSSPEQPVAPAAPTEPSLSPEAEERRIFET
jgi:transcriptional regulator with XRE-family HTH domain